MFKTGEKDIKCKRNGTEHSGCGKSKKGRHDKAEINKTVF